MHGVPAHIAKNSLDIQKDARPVKQALRRFATEKRHTIKEEIARLLAADFIGEVTHPSFKQQAIMSYPPRELLYFWLARYFPNLFPLQSILCMR